MLRISLGNLQPATQATPATLTTGWATKFTAALTPKYSSTSCPPSYSMQDGLCLSQGCVDGRSACTVRDARGNMCTYDQMLAAWQATGVKQCPASGALAPQETGQSTSSAAGGQVQQGTGQDQPPATYQAPYQAPAPGSQPAPNGLPGQSTQPGVVINADGSADYQPMIVGINWKRVGMVALGLFAVGGAVAMFRR